MTPPLGLPCATEAARRLAPVFPENFAWGVATSAFQIEGAATADGKGPSIWDRFCEVPGAIADASDAAVACDHYHRWPQDLDLIAGLGVDTYRFSLAWTRLRPDGAGAWNPRGLDFYERLVDGLLQRGVRPFITLNHWDLPQALQENGGWGSRDTVMRFVEYAEFVARRFGDRAPWIATHNEPWVIATLGHERGVFAPGLRDRQLANQVAHHLLLSHGLALQAMRSAGCQARLGIVLNLAPVFPASESAADAAAARLEDGSLVRWYLDPLFGRGYPADVLAALGQDAPLVRDGDLHSIATPMDFLGVNYYSRAMASANGTWTPASSGLELTAMNWEVYPAGLTELLTRLNRDYVLPPIYITENGAAFEDAVADDGTIADSARVRFLAAHLDALATAIAQGVPVAGYFVWSLLDNFEWASGYAKRFGIVHVDYETRQRRPKASAHWYRDFLRQLKHTSGTPRQSSDTQQEARSWAMSH